MKNQNLERIKAIKLEQDLAALTDPGAEVRRTVGRQIENVQTRLDTPFGGDEREMLELRIEQTRRAADAQREYDEAVERANLQIKSGIPAQVTAGNLAIDNATKRKKALDELLPILDEVEQKELRQQQILERYGFIQQEIQTAMSSAITAVITGTGTVEEAFASMFANIGKAFIDMATQMIAKALVMKALGILGGGGGGGSMFPMDTGGWTAPEGATPSTLGMNFFGKANGGPVGPNGTYLVGEQGPELLSMGNQPGYVHRNTSEVMDRYRNGGNQGGTAANLSVNYNVTDINGMRFVTEDQFRAGMTKAAKDGAKMGEAGTFKTMKNSRSSRARSDYEHRRRHHNLPCNQGFQQHRHPPFSKQPDRHNNSRAGVAHRYLSFIYQGAAKNRTGDNMEAQLVLSNNQISMSYANQAVVNKWNIEVTTCSMQLPQFTVARVLTTEKWLAASLVYDFETVEVTLSSSIDAVGASVPHRVLTTSNVGSLPTSGQIQSA